MSRERIADVADVLLGAFLCLIFVILVAAYIGGVAVAVYAVDMSAKRFSPSLSGSRFVELYGLLL